MGTTPEDVVAVFTYSLAVNKVDGNNQPLTGAGFTLYKKGTDGQYAQVGDEIKSTEENPITKFEFKGFDDGEYKLVETTTPAGYNSAEDVLFTATTEPMQYEGSGGGFSTNITSSNKSIINLRPYALETTVQNLKGSTLPETGGMGTKVIYLAGGALVVLASVLLVTKRRMSKNQ